MTNRSNTAYVFYQYFYPDNVVSAVHFTELCIGLAKRGWEVTAFPCNRGCRDDAVVYPGDGEIEGVRIERLWRPALRQSTTVGRIVNALWLILRWSILATQRGRRPDVVIIGTDPILSVLVAIAWRFFKPRTILANWCFDLYPEAAYAENLLSRKGLAAKLMHVALRKAYRACDLVVDIGPCMRSLLLRYDPGLRLATLTPWALEEPSGPLAIPPKERNAIFGKSRFGLLYSGTFGRAHSYQSILDLARLLRTDDVSLTFSIRGNREEALRAAVSPDDSNIRFVAFTTSENLQGRLASADVHVVTLRDEWLGTVVPSKFFGALAIGRPVLFCGDSQSAVAQWIQRHDLGWVLTPDNLQEVAESLRQSLKNPAAMQEMRERCHRIYHTYFSREIGIEGWDQQLTELQRVQSKSAAAR